MDNKKITQYDLDRANRQIIKNGDLIVYKKGKEAEDFKKEYVKRNTKEKKKNQ